jgi:hypothetical protein
MRKRMLEWPAEREGETEQKKYIMKNIFWYN